MTFILNVLGFLWRTLWRLLGLATVLSLSFVLLVFIKQGSDSQELMNRVKIGMEHLLRREGQYLDFKEGLDTAKNLVTDQVNPANSSRWQTNQANVYIETQDETFRQAYQSAIHHWNETGTFTFSLVDTASQADIVATEMNDGQTSAAGEAVSQTNSLTNYFVHVTVKLNRYYLLNPLYGYDMDRIVHTAEHELGHAIGLEHNDLESSVMESAGSYTGIQEIDTINIQNLYTANKE